MSWVPILQKYTFDVNYLLLFALIITNHLGSPRQAFDGSTFHSWVVVYMHVSIRVCGLPVHCGLEDSAFPLHQHTQENNLVVDLFLSVELCIWGC